MLQGHRRRLLRHWRRLHKSRLQRRHRRWQRHRRCLRLCKAAVRQSRGTAAEGGERLLDSGRQDGRLRRKRWLQRSCLGRPFQLPTPSASCRPFQGQDDSKRAGWLPLVYELHKLVVTPSGKGALERDRSRADEGGSAHRVRASVAERRVQALGTDDAFVHSSNTSRPRLLLASLCSTPKRKFSLKSGWRPPSVASSAKAKRRGRQRQKSRRLSVAPLLLRRCAPHRGWSSFYIHARRA